MTKTETMIIGQGRMMNRRMFTTGSLVEMEEDEKRTNNYFLKFILSISRPESLTKPEECCPRKGEQLTTRTMADKDREHPNVLPCKKKKKKTVKDKWRLWESLHRPEWPLTLSVSWWAVDDAWKLSRKARCEDARRAMTATERLTRKAGYCKCIRTMARQEEKSC